MPTEIKKVVFLFNIVLYIGLNKCCVKYNRKITIFSFSKDSLLFVNRDDFMDGNTANS